MNPVGVTEKGTCKEICECFFHIPRFCRKTDPEFSTRQIERPICPYKITLSFNQTKTFRNDPSNLPSDSPTGRNTVCAILFLKLTRAKASDQVRRRPEFTEDSGPPYPSARTKPFPGRHECRRDRPTEPSDETKCTPPIRVEPETAPPPRGIFLRNDRWIGVIAGRNIGRAPTARPNRRVRRIGHSTPIPAPYTEQHTDRRSSARTSAHPFRV